MSGYLDTRKRVRNNLVNLLKGFTAAEDRVFSTRATPIFEDEADCINIYVTSDTPKPNKSYDWNFKRHLSIYIEILSRFVKESELAEDKADQIAGHVENRILPNQPLQFPPARKLQETDEGDPGEVILDSISLVDVACNKTPEGLTDVYGIVLEFMGIYEYETYVPVSNRITPFETAGVTYDLEAKQEIAEQARDELTLEQ